MGSATTFAELIANPESEKVFLAELKLAQLLQSWTKTGGLTNVYQKTIVTKPLIFSAVTMKLSLLSGYAFVTNPSIDLTPYLGRKITIQAGGKSLTGYIKAAGTGETLGSERVTNGDMSSSTGWYFDQPATETISGGVLNLANSTQNYHCYQKNVYSDADYKVLFKSVFTILNYSAGGVRNHYAGGDSWTGITRQANGTYTEYFNHNHTGLSGNQTYIILTPVGGAPGTTLQIDNWSLKAVTAPSATGVTIVSTIGGSTYNWESDDGINPNATSFTVIIDPLDEETIILADNSTEYLLRTFVAVEEDGTAYTAKTSTVEVDATASTFWHDTTNSILYAHASDGGTPDDFTIIGYFWLYFATKGIILDSRYYEPYIADRGIPGISQSTPDIHWGISKISSGSIVFLNGRGYFDQIAKNFIWHNKTAKILLGGDSLAYAEYIALFTGRIVDTNFTSQEFSIELRSNSFDLLRKLPINNFWTSTWASLDPSAEGKPIPIYYGSYSAAQAPIVTCINSAYVTEPLIFSAVTMKLSLLSGYAFVTNPSIDLTPYLGGKITIQAGGKSLTGYIKAAGTGETLGSELAVNGTFTAWTGNNPDNWTLNFVEDASNYIEQNPAGKAHFVTNTSYNKNIYRNVLTQSALYYVAFDIDTVTTAGNGINVAAGQDVYYNTTGSKSHYSCSTSTFVSIYVNSGDYTFDNVTVKQVLTPSATGVTIVSTIGGSTYNWESDDGINPNATSFTVIIDPLDEANTYQFKICDCTYWPIRDITQVYVDYGGGAGWQTISHANEDLANATFTINSASFVLGTSRIKVAFEGYHNAGTLIEGAPEIVEDILTKWCGYASSDLNATSFTNSKTISECILNVPLETEISALTVIEAICKSDLAFFDEDGSGLLRYRTWTPTVSGTIPVIDSLDILEDKIPDVSDDTSRLFYKVMVGYGYLCEEQTYLYAESSKVESRYKYGKSEILTHDTYLRNSVDAMTLAGRLNFVTRDPSPILKVLLKAVQINKLLGDKIKVTLDRAPCGTAGGFNERIFELIGKDLSCFPLKMTLTGRDLLEFGSNVGFWMAATAPAWAAATAAEREVSGFWSDADGLIDPADPATKNQSLWW